MRAVPRHTASLLALLVALAAGCLRVELPRSPGSERFLLDANASPAPAGGGAAVLVADPDAAPGLEGRDLIFVERPHEVRRYARSAWAEPPARMLGPLLARALERGGFRVVAEGEPGPHLRLETELVALRQEFLSRPSQVRLGVRLRLLAPDGRLLAVRELEALEPAPTDDAYGGVVAANRAASRLLADLVAACAGASAGAGAGPAAAGR
jgi:cholesterol transport system auxiliary component